MVRANLLDRAIGFVAPARAAQRLKHRAAIEIMTRGYAGADRGRLHGSWRPKSTSADAEIAADGRILRDRMRDLVRNNPHAANAISVLVTHVIGSGILPRTQDARVNALFKRWAASCDADGNLDFAGLQALLLREMFESGDGLVRRRWRRLSDGLPVPLQLQVIETDLIDSSRHVALSGGGRIVQGIEFDALGRRKAYWMFGAHPGNAIFEPGTHIAKPIPASEIAHVFEKQRTQVRGAPWGAPVVAAIHDLGAYEDAELQRKRLEACMVGTLVGGDEESGVGMELKDEQGNLLPPGIYNVHGERVEKFAPGMFYNAVGGREIRFSQPAATGSYDTYKNSMLHTIAAGFRVPHALLSGRLDGVNYSSSKIGLEGFKRLVEVVQWQIVVPMLCEPLWRWFLEAAYVAGEIDSLDHPAEWAPPGFYSADPGRDVAARVAEVRAGFRDLRSVIAEQGENPDDVLARIAESNALLDQLGLVLDSDPRRMSGAGQLQQPPDTEPDDPDPAET